MISPVLHGDTASMGSRPSHSSGELPYEERRVGSIDTRG